MPNSAVCVCYSSAIPTKPSVKGTEDLYVKAEQQAVKVLESHCFKLVGQDTQGQVVTCLTFICSDFKVSSLIWGNGAAGKIRCKKNVGISMDSRPPVPGEDPWAWLPCAPQDRVPHPPAAMVDQGSP